MPAGGRTRGAGATGPAGTTRSGESAGTSVAAGTTGPVRAARSRPVGVTAQRVGRARCSAAHGAGREHQAVAGDRTAGRARRTLGTARTTAPVRAVETVGAARTTGTASASGAHALAARPGELLGSPAGAVAPGETAQLALAVGLGVTTLAALGVGPGVTGLLSVVREVRQVVAAGFAGAAVGATAVRTRPVAGRQRFRHVEGTRAATVSGGDRSGAGGAADPGAVRAAVRGGLPGGARHVHAADHTTGTTGTRPARTGSTGRGRTRGARGRTTGNPRAVGATTALTALRGAGLAGCEPVARLLLGAGQREFGGRLGDAARGQRGTRQLHLGGGGSVAGPGVRDGRAHDDRRNRPRTGDVDPDPGRQRRLGLAFLRPRGRTSRVRTVVGSRRVPYGGVPEG